MPERDAAEWLSKDRSQHPLLPFVLHDGEVCYLEDDVLRFVRMLARAPELRGHLQRRTACDRRHVQIDRRQYLDRRYRRIAARDELDRRFGVRVDRRSEIDRRIRGWVDRRCITDRRQHS